MNSGAAQELAASSGHGRIGFLRRGVPADRSGYTEAMQVVLNDLAAQSRILLQPKRRMTDEEFYDLCRANPDLRIEQTAEGEILIMPPTGGETGYQNHDLGWQLVSWARRDGRGRTFDSSTEFILPNGAKRSPDASWVERSRLARLTRAQKRKFLPLCPDFVVELTSPTHRLRAVQKKMREWVENGAQLAWLLDTDNRTAYIYRPGREPERLVAPKRLVGEVPVKGFVLDLTEIWDPDL